MIKQEMPNFIASKYAPNPLEVTYWIDLSADANGNIIKSYNGKNWLPLNNQGGGQDLAELKQLIDNEVNRAKQAEHKINTAVANKVTSTDVTQIKIVDEIPEVGSQTPGILYIKLSAA